MIAVAEQPARAGLRAAGRAGGARAARGARPPARSGPAARQLPAATTGIVHARFADLPGIPAPGRPAGRQRLRHPAGRADRPPGGRERDRASTSRPACPAVSGSSSRARRRSRPASAWRCRAAAPPPCSRRTPIRARLWVARLDLPAPVLDYLHPLGPADRLPLRARRVADRRSTRRSTPASPARPRCPRPGAPSAPTCSERLAHAGVGFATLTLHTGVASLEDARAALRRAVRRAAGDGRRRSRRPGRPAGGCSPSARPSCGRSRAPSTTQGRVIAAPGLDRPGHHARARGAGGRRAADRLPRAEGLPPGDAGGDRRAGAPGAGLPSRASRAATSGTSSATST